MEEGAYVILALSSNKGPLLSVICDTPRHPYTKALISAVPIPDPVVERQRRRIRLPGELPSAIDATAALRFMPSKVYAQ